MRFPKSLTVSFCFSVLHPSHTRFPQFAPDLGFCSFRKLFRSQGPFQLGTRSKMDAVGYGFPSDIKGPNGCGKTEVSCVWASPEGGQKIDIGKHIFCNRAVNMKNIVAVGFDMDYTLAQYKPETFESLAYNGTVKKLVANLGYPNELLDWSFDWTYMVRGLVLDKKRGNILKMDRHKYVKVAYHGFRLLSKDEKVATYGNTLVRDAFDEPDYALIDTLFSLAEAYLFAQLVDFKDNNPEKISEEKDYFCMYRDVRAAVDLCHRDGTLKQMVANDPKKYINEDNSIVPMLQMLRTSGFAVFLVTNSLYLLCSLWDYTNVVMNFLCGPPKPDGSSSLTLDWLKHFDVVISGSAKPKFFHDENRTNLFAVDTDSGMLINTDNGSPMAQVCLVGGPSLELPDQMPDKSYKVFQGGNVGHLHKLLNVESSSQVLYVGDHIYGDILRSKKVLGWRTMLVVPELEKEVKLLWHLRDTRKQLMILRSERDHIEDQIHHLKWSLQCDCLDAHEAKKAQSKLGSLEVQRERVRVTHQEAQKVFHEKFHKVWGQLMKTGYQNSRFAHQVERFACLYTSQVGNLGLYSPAKYYRPSEDFMPHEFDIFSL
ncbi:5'-nucleotidase domain-containing protein 4 isoform X4 [Helianthus annuus]|uniref:5'-nucleotidase domain-containing protein 4 isoform X4 n=1 Tax=Helianthus annuus TaxID=4232 RepID=UPI001652D5FA|nr:5'-nucleotidase domain-containing protein 4 isoform X4 [Helianthus annuus]